MEPDIEKLLRSASASDRKRALILLAREPSARNLERIQRLAGIEELSEEVRFLARRVRGFLSPSDRTSRGRCVA